MTASEKGIPIFIFIDKKTLSALYFWKENRDGDFTKFVDIVRIFEFIESVRDNSKYWTYEFEKAKNIVSILKIQLSSLFKEVLKIKSKYEDHVPEYFKLNLSSKAIKLLVNKPDLYEIEFLSQTLNDEMNKLKDFNND